MVSPKLNSENRGAVFVFISAALWGAFPVIVHQWTNQLPPLFFGASLALFCASAAALWMLIRGKGAELKEKRAYRSFILVSLFIIVIPNALFFIGTQYTTGMNSSVLMLAEIPFTLLFTPFFGEKNTREKYIGALAIMGGSLLILYKGEMLSFNKGDALIIASTFTFPLGNFHSKKALYYVSSSTLLFVRYLIGGIILLAISALTEPVQLFGGLLASNFWLFFSLGFILLTLCKISFYEGVRILDISKVASLEMTYPFFSLLVLVFIYDTSVQLNQIIGVAVMIFGSFYAIKRKSVRGGNLKYLPK